LFLNVWTKLVSQQLMQLNGIGCFQDQRNIKSWSVRTPGFSIT
jgi:hypothetical protein